MKLAIVFVALFGFIVSEKWKYHIHFSDVISLIKVFHFRLLHWRIQVLRPAFLVKVDSWVEKASMLLPKDQTIVDAQIAIQNIQKLAMVVFHLLVPTVDQPVHADANRL